MSDIPNQAGFRLMGVLRVIGPNIPLKVERNPVTGCHYLVDNCGARWPVNLFSTWLPDGGAK